MNWRRTRPAWITEQDWSGLVVICSGTSWDGPRLSDRHLAERLTRWAPVLFVDPPISSLTPLRRPELRKSALSPGLSHVSGRLARLTPLAPPGVSRPVLRQLARLATRRAMKRAVGRLGCDVEAVILGSLDDLFGACGERQSILWGTDDFAAAGSLMGLPTEWLRQREDAQLARADVVTAVSDELAARWRSKRPDVVVIPNGCDLAHFADSESAPLPDSVTLPEPIATFVGHLSERIDMACLESVAETNHSLLLVGPRQATFESSRMEALLRRPNVQWVGPQPFEDLPSFMRVTSVGLTPYANSDFNRASFPLKTLEYLAAGKRVISTDLPAARGLAVDVVTIVSSAAEFGLATAAALETPQAGSADVARAQAAQHDWDARTRDIARLLGLVDREEATR
jgi:teichuronic acid biosynthesis glycosyltransferase TuaH